MVRLTSSDPNDHKLLDDVREFGWHVIHVLAEGDDPEFTYSIGASHSFDIPEMIVIGLPRDVAHSVMRIVVDLAREGDAVDTKQPTDALFEGNLAHFVPVPKDAYNRYVGYAIWFYEGRDFPLVQIVWPSKTGILPWDSAATTAYRAAQPVLGAPSK